MVIKINFGEIKLNEQENWWLQRKITIRFQNNFLLYWAYYDIFIRFQMKYCRCVFWFFNYIKDASNYIGLQSKKIYWVFHFTLEKVKLRKTHKIFRWKRYFWFNTQIELCHYTWKSTSSNVLHGTSFRPQSFWGHFQWLSVSRP